MRDLALLTSSCLPLFIVAYQNRKDVRCPGIKPRTSLMESNKSSTVPGYPYDVLLSFMHNRWLMAKKSLNIIEKMMDPNIIDYRVLHNQLCNTIDNHNRKLLPNRYWRAWIHSHENTLNSDWSHSELQHFFFVKCMLDFSFFV